MRPKNSRAASLSVSKKRARGSERRCRQETAAWLGECAPLPDHVGGKRGGLEGIGHGPEFRREARLLRVLDDAVLQARVNLVPSRHERLARRRADVLDVVVIQLRTLLDQIVQHRCLQLRRAAQLLLAPRHVVAAPVCSSACAGRATVCSAGACRQLRNARWSLAGRTVDQREDDVALARGCRRGGRDVGADDAGCQEPHHFRPPASGRGMHRRIGKCSGRLGTRKFVGVLEKFAPSSTVDPSAQMMHGIARG